MADAGAPAQGRGQPVRPGPERLGVWLVVADSHESAPGRAGAPPRPRAGAGRGRREERARNVRLMTTPTILTPLPMRGRTARNRLWLPPMCMYSVDAHDGVATDWHVHS